MSEKDQELIKKDQEIAELKARVKELEEMVKYLTKKLYGTKSEKVNPDQLSLLTDDDSVFNSAEHPADQSKANKTDQTCKKPAQKRQKTSRAETLDSKVEVKVTILKPDQDHCIHGHKLTKVGCKLLQTKLRYVPAKLVKEEIYTEIYKCEDADDEQTIFYQAQAATGLFAHSLATPDLVAEIIYDKLALGTPLYRQLQNWQRLGWQTSNATLANWVINGAKLVKPVYDAIHKHLLAQPYLQGDETTVQVLREAKRPAQSKSYAWVMRTVERAKQAAVYYAYSPTRASSFAQELYQGFTGVLQCDGYAGYNQVASKARVGCWAHTRRKFFDALKTDEQAQVPFDLIQKMFAKERMWQDLPAAERLVMRQKELQPLLDEFWKCVSEIKVLPKSRLGKAIAYANGQQEYLNHVLDYGEVDLSNNTCEQAVKTLVIDRKNFLFSTNPKGAEANAIWLTLIKSATENGIDALAYLKLLLEELPKLGAFPPEEALITYMPWEQKSTNQEVA